jgi:hypothetical protein
MLLRSAASFAHCARAGCACHTTHASKTDAVARRAMTVRLGVDAVVVIERA